MSPKPQRLFPRLTGAIFAGGESRRMGQPKEGILLWDGRPMLAHVIDALAPLCEKILIVGHCRCYEAKNDPRVIHIEDNKPGLGPVTALETLLSSNLGSHYLVASCDQPLLTPDLLQLLMDGASESLEQPVFFKDLNGMEFDPFPGVFPASLLPLVQQSLEAGQLAIRKVLHQGEIQWVKLPEAQRICLSNCNTPESVAALHAVMHFKGLA